MSEDQQPHHDMVLEKKHAAGADEWYCPTCGRRFLLYWPPKYKKIILEPGDEHAFHSGTQGSVNLQSSQIHPKNGSGPDDDTHLDPYQEWMDKVDFASWWTEED